jgi:type IV secretory pathway VirJ component
MNRAKVIPFGLVIGLLGLGLPLAAESIPPADSVGDLPLSLSPTARGSLLAVLLSGDGGWAAGDKSLAKAFASQSVAVAGLNSPRYLERGPTPDEAAGDLARILRHFLYSWSRQRVIVVGYSRGADIGPFMVARLPSDLRNRVAMLVLLGPGKQASFKLSMLDITRDHHDNGGLPVEPEVAKLRAIPVLCIYGATDRGAICQSLSQAGLARTVMRNRGHVVHGDEGPALVQEILAQLPPTS